MSYKRKTGSFRRRKIFRVWFWLCFMWDVIEILYYFIKKKYIRYVYIDCDKYFFVNVKVVQIFFL